MCARSAFYTHKYIYIYQRLFGIQYNFFFLYHTFGRDYMKRVKLFSPPVLAANWLSCEIGYIIIIIMICYNQERQFLLGSNLISCWLTCDRVKV